MVHTIKLDGEQKPVLFGNLAFKWLKEEKGITLGEIGRAMESGDITIISTVLYYGLRAAERYEKRISADYDADDVALWMDIQGGVSALVLPWILDAINDMTGEGNAKENGEAKKKTAKA